MATIRFGYTPTHPGEVLKDEIEYRGFTAEVGRANGHLLPGC